MTNKEKSIDIVAKMPNTFKIDFAEKCCLEMAEWKDQQFKEYLEKKKEEIERTEDAGSFIAEMSLTAQSNLLTEIINELFKED